MDLIPGVVLFFGAIGTVALLVGILSKIVSQLLKLKCSSLVELEQLSHNKREEGCLTEDNYG